MQAPDSSSRQLKIVQWLVKGTIEAQAAALENKAERATTSHPPRLPHGACLSVSTAPSWVASLSCVHILSSAPQEYGRWCVVPAAHDLWTGRLQGDNLVSHECRSF